MRYIITIIVVIVMLTGCSQKESDSSNYYVNDEVIEHLNKLEFNDDKMFKSENRINIQSIPDVHFDVEDFEEIHLNMSQSASDPSSYIIALPMDGKEKLCQAQISAFIESFKASYEDYNPLAEKMINNALQTKMGEYLVVIISSDNDRVLSELQAGSQIEK